VSKSGIRLFLYSSDIRFISPPVGPCSHSY
jgi:hypothetical protein